MADAVQYRTRAEEEAWRPRDPIILYRERLIREDVATETELDKIDHEMDEFVADAIQFAEESPEPTVDDMYRDVYAA